MKLGELLERLDKMYKLYGDIDVMIDLSQDNNLDDTIYIDTDTKNIWTESVKDITEVKDDNGDEITGICISNYVMEDKNWGKDD